MLSPEIQKLVNDGALRYFTPEQLEERSSFDEAIDFLQSLDDKQAEPPAFELRVTLESDRPRMVTVIIK